MTNEVVLRLINDNTLSIIIPIIMTLSLIAMYQSIREYRRIKQANIEKEASAKMAEAHSKMMAVKSFDDLMKIVDNIAGVYIAYEVLPQINGEITLDERETLLINCTSSVCAGVYNALSPELKRQLACYIEVNPDEDDDYLRYYLRKTIMTNISSLIDKKTENPAVVRKGYK